MNLTARSCFSPKSVFNQEIGSIYRDEKGTCVNVGCIRMEDNGHSFLLRVEKEVDCT